MGVKYIEAEKRGLSTVSWKGGKEASHKERGEGIYQEEEGASSRAI